MLVLSRKLNQEIIIGDGIRVRVLKVKGNTIRLGIDAPQDVKIVRGELQDKPKIQDKPRQPPKQLKEVVANSRSTPVDLQSEEKQIVANQELVDQVTADFTVVFSVSPENAANCDIIPFDPNETATSSQSIDLCASSSHDSVATKDVKDKHVSVSFQQQVPEKLTHNRLKEIVKHVTREN